MGDAWQARVVRSDIERFAGEGTIETREYADVVALLEARARGAIAARRRATARDGTGALDHCRLHCRPHCRPSRCTGASGPLFGCWIFGIIQWIIQHSVG